jgi:myosin heavy subunit
VCGVRAARGAGSYHIFYQLCTSQWAPALSLGGAEQYKYLAASGCTSVPGKDDGADFEEVLEALTAMGFGQEDVQWVFSLCAATLHMGNVRFAPIDAGEGSAVDGATQAAVSCAAMYLGVDAATLSAALTERQIAIRGEVQQMRNKVAQAVEAAEALAKAAYSSLFDELVLRINKAVGGERGVSIGVLDIFGFEIFEINSYEQLCINFTNERLQARFHERTSTPTTHLIASRPIRIRSHRVASRLIPCATWAGTLQRAHLCLGGDALHRRERALHQDPLCRQQAAHRTHQLQTMCASSRAVQAVLR